MPHRTDDVEFANVAPADVADLADQLQATYEAMYGPAVGSATSVDSMLDDHAARPGFRMAMARQADDGSMVGFGYGFTGVAGQEWRDEVAEAVGSELAARWLSGHFEFAEFGVVPALQRRGIGTRLYGMVFEGLPHRQAVLTVREDNAPAIAFYARHGWVAFHGGFVAGAGHGPYTIMGLHR